MLGAPDHLLAYKTQCLRVVDAARILESVLKKFVPVAEVDLLIPSLGCFWVPLVLDSQKEVAHEEKVGGVGLEEEQLFSVVLRELGFGQNEERPSLLGKFAPAPDDAPIGEPLLGDVFVSVVGRRGDCRKGKADHGQTCSLLHDAKKAYFLLGVEGRSCSSRCLREGWLCLQYEILHSRYLSKKSVVVCSLFFQFRL